ncbi:glutamate--tRNA ligase [bacterium]|nr:glutamate--tRNA ligase [bacterium]
MSPRIHSKIENTQVRVRLAPSPTGFLHIGTARVALFNFLFARKNNGKFILRIEDTDKERSKIEYENDILENLKWLGIEWDEGPVIGERSKYKGNYGPYRQSERSEIYRRYIKKLIEEDKAYYCFCTKEELEAQRQYLISIGQPPRYLGKCRGLDKKKVSQFLKEGRPAIIRFKTPAKKIVFVDIIRGKIEFDTSLIGDFSIAKDENSPLYNLAVVIDDFEMKISHVIRGEDHISNTPKQILLQQALGFPSPQWAHLPLILGPDRSKLSKRHGAVSVNQYKKDGYLPEALINIMAFLGWNPGTEREIYSMSSLIKDFSLERCQKGGAIFNIKRLNWINGFYIRQYPTQKLTELCLPYLEKSGLIEEVKNEKLEVKNPNKNTHPEELRLFKEEKRKFRIKDTNEIIDIDWITKIIALYQERLKKLSEITELVDFFFVDKIKLDKDLLRWKEMTDEEIKQSLDAIEKVLSGIEPSQFTKETIEKSILPVAEEIGDRGKLLWPFRAALSGKKASAGPFEIAAVLGKKKTIKRIKEAKEIFK